MEKLKIEFEEFLNSLQLLPATRYQYNCHVDIFLAYLPEQFTSLEGEIDKALALHSVTSVMQNPNTHAVRNSAINLFLRFLIETEKLPANFPLLGSPIRPFMVPKQVPSWIFDYLIKTTNLHNFYETRNTAVILLIYATGLSLSSIRNLRVSDIQLTTAAPCVKYDSFYCPIFPEAARVLYVYYHNFRRFILKSSPYFFTTSKGRQLAPNSICVALQNNLPKAVDEVTAGTIRNTFAATLLANGAPLLLVANVLGVYSNQSLNRLKSMVPPAHPVL
jgi:site-specific recombinase XerD